MSAKLTAGGEVVSYCTKCRLDLGHRIIALVDGVPVKVECQTCGSHHKYRRPAEEVAIEKRLKASGRSASRIGSSAKSSTTKSSTSRTVSARASTKVTEQLAREAQWQARIAGQMSHAFVKYSPKSTFQQDTLVHHAKFGDGYVVEVIDAHKIEVMFQDGPRVLAQGI